MEKQDTGWARVISRPLPAAEQEVAVARGRHEHHGAAERRGALKVLGCQISPLPDFKAIGYNKNRQPFPIYNFHPYN